jgi:hypothetical protein
MNRYFVITIDVEPDCTPTWRYADPLTFKGVCDGIKKILQPLFNKYDACPTYLINNVVLEDGESTEVFLGLNGQFELGTHLHAEFIEPQKQFSNYAGKKGEANQYSLPPETEFKKMENITRLFERNFGKKPTSFRAGRFGAGKNTIKSLHELGYHVDTSVTPHVCWNDKTRKVPLDYTRTPEQPYFVSEDSFPTGNVKGKILEVPVSIIRNRKFFRLKPLWLRPHLSDFRDFLKIMDVQNKNNTNEDLIVYNMMFHQVEVIPGLSPYTQTLEESKKYLSTIEAFLAHCKKANIKSTSLSSLYDIYRKG